jgi:hypothetical protein
MATPGIRVMPAMNSGAFDVGNMPSRLLRPEELAALDAFPSELRDDEIGAYYTLNSSDLDLVRSRGPPRTRLRLALQLCGLRHLGVFPDNVAGAPAKVISWLAAQVEADAADITGYGTRYKTVLEHRASCAQG